MAGRKELGSGIVCCDRGSGEFCGALARLRPNIFGTIEKIFDIRPMVILPSKHLNFIIGEFVEMVLVEFQRTWENKPLHRRDDDSILVHLQKFLAQTQKIKGNFNGLQINRAAEEIGIQIAILLENICGGTHGHQSSSGK